MRDLIRREDVLNLAKNITFTDDKGRPVYKHICVNLENVRSIPAVDAVEVVRCKDYSAKQLENAPAVDAVEVVRCRECEMANQCSDEREMYCTLYHCYKGKTYFCADGKRREDGEDG